MRRSTLWKSGVLSLLLLGFALSVTIAQQRTVTGNVTSEDQGALPGVNIVVQGTTQGAVTDGQGNFTISVSGDDATLVFSFIGYTTQAVPVGNQTTINLTLTPDVTSLDEIVVTAYATQKKKDLTGSVSVVKADELVQMPQGSVTQQLQGRVAGVTVTQDSRPGQSGKVRIRGFGSFQNNSPLYVVDGVPIGNVVTISPNDVESMTVLKDAGAASIYGSRASNGVIVITTKKGQAQGIKVNYNMYLGQQSPGPGPDNMLSSTEYADLQWLVYANDGTTTTHPIYGPSSNASPTMPFWASDTKWWDEVFSNAFIMNHDLSLSGGNQNSKFYASLGYFDQDGVVITNWFKRYTARFNSEFKIKDRVTVGENMNVAFRTDNGTARNGDENTGLMMGVYRQQPIVPVIWDSGPFQGLNHFYEDGEWGGTGIASNLGNQSNYIADNTRDQDDRWQEISVVGNIFADVKILEGLNLRTSFGGGFRNWYQTNWTGSTYENNENTATSSYSEAGGYGATWTWTNTLTFNRQFGDHNIMAVLGYEAVKTGIGRENSANKAGYFSDSFAYRTVSNGANLVNASSSFYTPRSLVSQFLRADYNFRNKYYVSGTVRRDGASVFGEDTRYGVFPSGSGGWRISEESFLEGVSFISDLKIRGGYGTMGNQLAVNPSNQFYLYGGSGSTTSYDMLGTTSSALPGFRPTRIGNPEGKWETSVVANVGFDAVLFNRKFELAFDWYTKQNLDLLFDPELPGTAGAASRPFVNVGEMKNTGIDLQFIYHQIWSDFSLEINAQLTTYTNEIVAIAEGIPYFDSGGSRIGSFNRNIEGQEMGEFFGYNMVGIFQSETEVDGAATQDGAEEGFLRFADTDGNGEITPEDRVSIGNPNPDFTYGLNLVLGYKGFDLTAFFYGSQGNDIFNYNKWWVNFWPAFQGQKSTDLLYDSWTPTNTGASVPKASNKANFSTSTVSNSYYVEDASFFRMKNLQLGYNFPKSILGNVFSSMRIYVQATNLFTITGYTGLDPELASFNDDYTGVDEGNLPAMKQFLVGVNVGF